MSKRGNKRKGVAVMNKVTGKTFDEERALYGARNLIVEDCRFDGPADGESAFKEGRDIQVENSFFNLRYPFWHDEGLQITGSEMTEFCRAALWYSHSIMITDTKLHGIKALRECSDVRMQGCDIVSPEFGWSVTGLEMEDCTAESEYFMMRSDHLTFRNMRMKGKYSFQYISDALFEDCTLDTKDAFWHASNVTVRNCTVKGEYLAWYCENVTFENCKIMGTQPLCYCKGLKLVNCEMTDADLCFEKSEVEATLTTPVESIKNPLSGHIYLPGAAEIIRDDERSRGEVIFLK
jgi:Endopolygalacturonase